jgi:hypothetical protein
MRPAAGEDGDPALENRVRPGHDNKRRGDDKWSDADFFTAPSRERRRE